MPDFTVPPELSTPADVEKSFLVSLAGGLRDRGLEGVPKGLAAMTAARGQPIVPDPLTGQLSVEAPIELAAREVVGGRMSIATAITAISGTISAEDYQDYAGRVTPYNNTGNGTWTLSGAIPSGTVFAFVQVSTGVFRLAASGGLTLRHPLGHDRTAGQWSAPLMALVIGADVLLWGGTASA